MDCFYTDCAFDASMIAPAIIFSVAILIPLAMAAWAYWMDS